MKLICKPQRDALPVRTPNVTPVLLYGRLHENEVVSIGAAVEEELNRKRFSVAPDAWDLLSLALSVIAADTVVLKSKSADGWTREIDLDVAVKSPDKFTANTALIQQLLRFLTTDIWQLRFTPSDYELPNPPEVQYPTETTVALLSGGIDSLVGALDLVATGARPLVVSQVVTGDAEKQTQFAAGIGGGLHHVQLNHNVAWSGINDLNQRARSFIFLAYGVVVATALEVYREGETVNLYVNENGLISINPPLTDARLGSLSTRTTHPVFLALMQQLLDSLGVRVRLLNLYQLATKGEMLASCRDQSYLRGTAHMATSCGRFRRMGFKHCGRCVPCLIRRAAFHRWQLTDQTTYVYEDLGRNESAYSGFDDVRAAAMAVAIAADEGIDALLGASLASSYIPDAEPYRAVVDRGLCELRAFLHAAGVK